MSPIIIAIDIVRFSLNRAASLGPAVEDFFTQVGSIRDCNLKSHLIPTGDGAILIWRTPRDTRAPISTAQRAIADVLEILEGWCRKHVLSVRVGVHSDFFVEDVTILGHRSVFGHGISECVRYMSAADENQALVSETARNHLTLTHGTAGLTLGSRFAFFDKHGLKHLAFPLGRIGHKHWSIEISASAHETSVRADLRPTEVPANNNFLQKATSAQFLAMTFKTLGAALKSGKSGMKLKRLRTAELYIYALPSLKSYHPTIKDPNTLEQEWTKGLRETIEGMLNPARCPCLGRLDLIVLSAPPSLTATEAVAENEQGATERLLRIHPVLDNCEPSNIPTLIVSRTDDNEPPLYLAFRLMMQNVGRTSNPLRFPLRRGNHEPFREIAPLIERLQLVCTHPTLAPHDRYFRAFLHSSLKIDSLERTATFLDGHRRTNELQVKWRKSDDCLIFALKGGSNLPLQSLKGHHLCAFFVLMTWEKRLLLVHQEKVGWSHDVPGGKVAETDDSGSTTVQREVFQELALVLDAARIGEPMGAVFDHRSAKEKGLPVVAHYVHYPLNREERHFFDLIDMRSTKGDSLVFYPLERLLNEKRRHQGPNEAVCHASLGVINAVLRTLARLK